mgnify:CR=1 FL=1
MILGNMMGRRGGWGGGGVQVSPGDHQLTPCSLGSGAVLKVVANRRGILRLLYTRNSRTTLAFCSRTRLFQLAESLGGVESLISHPASMTHASVELDRRKALGVTEGLIRLSVGVEDAADLLGDLEQAFKGL